MQDFEQMRIVLVADNGNRRGLGSISETSPPAETGPITSRPGTRQPPRQGSWRNLAEIQFGVLSRRLRREGVRVKVHFTTTDARLKLKSLYPSIR